MSKFRTIAVFAYPAEAAVIKSKLESENISVFLRDEFTIATDPFATNAIGGVKMDVYKEDYIKAIGLIEKSNPEITQRITHLVICPKCKKRAVREQGDVMTATTFAERLKAVLLSIFPFSSDKHYKCMNCSHKFDLNE
ncbi:MULTISPECIES: hypothetical protein [Nonlabens]|uniref:DUF2007 domain-containing protein n=2 Tax=Nonlabens ulvanivorans TaxID=906888 RepID=A0A084JUE6_NONUL|nr:hypothetical protein [Nonlabens ulvanivorans]KEZ92580.1 hypothetical protein IL45_10560 [Nonlabens ulvanivorans]PRX15420.1 hypothetical protein LY02_00637 [Nonlabens ulvanivorans]WOI22230.1 hypothetical protein R1T42_11200 [Nonlabens ulvanivorans]